jgi:hypothetical protein
MPKDQQSCLRLLILLSVYYNGPREPKQKQKQKPTKPRKPMKKRKPMKSRQDRRNTVVLSAPRAEFELPIINTIVAWAIVAVLY